ncbi:hypothetical protein BCF55_1573 [Hydrogenivirga caldilitoris]|uniref:DUF8082 domain-containing protein n=1 Tax=Hydrogenivirga caldilitoris TaxID=246264 RepID=A0A497XSJ4_9AQUI|nr:hypothetical protein BCF55_1573 [Hydrogenivirga caldilitoris]
MSSVDERSVQELLAKERSLSKAKALVIFSKNGFVRIEDHDMNEREVNTLVNTFCGVVSELSKLESGDSFFLGKLGNNLVYLAPISSDICFLGIFSEDANLLKLYQSMGVLSEVLKNKSGELDKILKSKKVDFLKKSQESKPVYEGEFLTPFQVDMILEEFKNEIGPAANIVFKSIVRDRGFDLRHLTKEDAYELVNRLAEKIGSLERKRKFLDISYKVIEGS